MTADGAPAAALGSLVNLGDGSIVAAVVGVLIREDGTTYEVAWYAAGQRHTAWIYPCELGGIGKRS